MWIIKNSKGQYCKIDANDNEKWVNAQRSAFRFKTKKSAQNFNKILNSLGLVKSKVVKLKCCEKESLPKPKVDTVFFSPFLGYPSIITTVVDYGEAGDAEVYTIDSIHGEDVWGSLEDYWKEVNSGTIKILWEPEQ